MRRLSSSSMKLRSSSGARFVVEHGDGGAALAFFGLRSSISSMPVLRGESGSDRSSRGWRRRPGGGRLNLIVGQVAFFLAGFEQDFRPSSIFSIKPSSRHDPARLRQRKRRVKGGAGVSPPHGFTVGQLPEQFQGRSWSPADCSWLWEFLSGRAGAALLKMFEQRGAAKPRGRGCTGRFLVVESLFRQARVVQAAA